jgi:RNA-binding protein
MVSEITPGKKRFVKRQLAEGKPSIWIGKGGLSPEILKEITKQLDKNKMVKIKILKTALQDNKAEQIALEIASKTCSVLVEVKGHMLMFYKRRQK